MRDRRAARSAVQFLLLVLCSVAVPAAPLAAQAADTARASDEPLFSARDALFAGGFVLGTIVLAPLDRQIAAEFRRDDRQANRVYRNTATTFRILGVPGSLGLAAAAYAVGRVTDQERLADIGLHTTEAVVIGGGINYLIKGLAGRARPFLDPDDPLDFRLGRGFGADQFRSFPSGHTTAAFAAAAAVTTEVAERDPDNKWWVGTLLYGSAALVGASRSFNNKHWASDVMVGAAIGSFSGWKAVAYNHDRPDNEVDELLLGVTIPTNGGPLLLWVLPRRR